MNWEAEPLQRYRAYSGAGRLLMEIIENEDWDPVRPESPFHRPDNQFRWRVIVDDGLVGRCRSLAAAKLMAAKFLHDRGLRLMARMSNSPCDTPAYPLPSKQEPQL